MTSILEIILKSRPEHIVIALFFVAFIPLSISAQKLPEVRVDQKDVSEETLFIEATRARLLGDFDVAENKLKLLIDRHEEKAVFHYEMARVYQEIGALNESKKSIKKAIELEPENEWYLQYLINLAEQEDDQQEIIAAYRALSKLFPDRHYYLENIAFHQLRNEQPDEALKTLTQLEEVSGINFETSRQKHLIYDTKREIDQAYEVLDQYIETYPNDTRMLLIAGDYSIENQNPGKAAIYYEAVLKVEPTNAKARAALMSINGSDKENTDKLTNYLSDPKVKQDDKIMQLIPIITDFQSGNSSYTGEQLQNFASLLIDQYGENAKTTALLGDVYSIQNKPDSAAINYKKSIAIDDGNYFVWEQLMYVLTDLSDSDELGAYAEEAMDIYPNQPMPYAFYALYQAITGDFTSANDWLSEARIRCGTNNELIQDVLAIDQRIRQLKGQ